MPRLTQRVATRPTPAVPRRNPPDAARGPVRASERLLPSEVLRQFAYGPSGARPAGRVAYDTETSGLHPDDGASVAVASIAWEDPHGFWREWGAVGALTWRTEHIAPGYSVNIASIAWPFDQGVEAWCDTHPKDEYFGQGTLDLYPNRENLPAYEWSSLMGLCMAADLIMHNGKFDALMSHAPLRPHPGTGGVDLMLQLAWDTSNVNTVLWPLELVALKPTFERLWPELDYGDASKLVKAYLKKNKLPKGRWDLVPWEIIGPYADGDARMTKMIELRQIWEIDHNGGAKWLYEKDDSDAPCPEDAVYRSIARKLATTRWLYNMERRGLPYDEVASRTAGDATVAVGERLAREELPFEPNDARKWFFETGFVATKSGRTGPGLVPYAMTEPTARHPEGQPQLTAEILARMVDDAVPYAAEYAVYTKIKLAASMWYYGYAEKIGPDNRLRTVFRQHGTRSTRFSVERANLQAIPQDYRMSDYAELAGIPSPRQIIAAYIREFLPGWALWELDAQQAELRIGAMISQCTPMLDMLTRGEDLHGYTTSQLFNMDESHPRWKYMRQVGKRANFTLGFGAWAKTFMRMLEKETGIRMPLRKAEKLVTDWNKLYPEWSRSIDRHERMLKRRVRQNGYGWVVYGNGERRWFQPYEDTRKAFNQRVQGNQAQFSLEWGLRAEAFLLSQGLGRVNGGDAAASAGMIIPIHDSQNVLVPDNAEGEALVESVAQIGRDVWAEYFPKVGGGVDAKRW